MLQVTRVLGIDPGVARLGYGILEDTQGQLRPILYGCFETPPHMNHAARLAEVHKILVSLIKKYKPNRVAVEKLFFSKNTKTALAVGEARGVVLMTCAALDIPIVELAPKEVKSAVVGYGSADKSQVQKMVQLILKLDHIPKPDDAADALAIAICATRFSLLQ